MPRIFDNISTSLLPALREALDTAHRADFCVGYFNLRGWQLIDEMIDDWAGDDASCCRLLIGMHESPKDTLRHALRLGAENGGIDLSTVARLKRQVAEEFREQLAFGAPSTEDEAGLRRLSAHLRSRKLRVKLHLRYPLHAKLYLFERDEYFAPLVGFVGSSNLTMSGLVKQGELNVDVVEEDAARKLQDWFNDRWKDRWCLDISDDLADIIDESWAGLREIPPYLIYLKMAYHLSQEARSGLSEFRIPAVFGDQLFDFQVDAVKIAARYLNRRGGVLIGDVVGLGKTLMATALAKVFEEDHDGLGTLIICPANLVNMWEDHRLRYGLHAKVVSLARVQEELQRIPPGFRLVLIDESHNLRNREGARYRAIQEYITKVG
ncbi:MAG: NgoFVII family restriction endonuclease, partial [Chloroflexi bacterium]